MIKYLGLALIFSLGSIFQCLGEEKPNILFIVADDLGWRDAGFMGSSVFETPRLDSLAQQGLVFSQAYAGAANCAPSRACLMTGRQTPRHGIYTVGSSERGDPKTRRIIPTENTIELADSETTLAEQLATQGYQSAQIGKWHLGDDSRDQGFATNIGGWSSGSPAGGYFAPWKNPFLESGPDGEYLTDRLTTEAISWLEQRNRDQPFFLYLPYYAVHTPLQGKPDLVEKYRQKLSGNSTVDPDYAAMVENLDTQIGRLLDSLETFDAKRNTLIIFTSDNGGIRSVASQEPLRAGKGSYYEGGIRVPCIAVWQEKIKPGRRSDQVISFLDWFPTLSQLVGAPLPKNPLDGIDISRTLLVGTPLPERSLYFHFPIYLQAYEPNDDDGRDPLFRTRPGSVIRKGNWKLHQYFEDGGLELYDLEADIGERTNLVEAQPERAAQLLSELEAWREQLGAPVPDQRNPLFDPKVSP